MCLLLVRWTSIVRSSVDKLAGDIAVYPDKQTGHYRRIEHWNASFFTNQSLPV